MKIDEYGQHTILSLYYDTDDFRFIRHSMDKPKYKEISHPGYGVPSQDSLVFLEIKKKVNGIVYKRRVPLAIQIINHGYEAGNFLPLFNHFKLPPKFVGYLNKTMT